MKGFARLFSDLDETNKTTRKVEAMRAYFTNADPADAVWALYFLMGRRPKRPVSVTKIWEWAAALCGLPGWLLDESYDSVGDMAETIAIILPEPDEERAELPLHTWVEDRLLPMQKMEEPAQRELMERSWRELDRTGRFVWNKLITGAFRVGVSRDLVICAIAQAANVPATSVAHRLMGNWVPSAAFFHELFTGEGIETDVSKPYPFCLAYALAEEPQTLGPIEDWMAEWKWDGIRCQLIRRKDEVFVWTRGEELVSDRYPEVLAVGHSVPDGTVLDGEAMAWRGDGPMPFAELQKRIGRKVVGKKLLADVPVALVAFDVLEWEGLDIRKWAYTERRALLERIVAHVNSPSLRLSAVVKAQTWEELAALRQESRSYNVEGLMLKGADSQYGVGRKKGAWWKWKIQPFTVDAVLMYAARGSGIRASLYTDYTFGIWREGELVPFAKAYTGLNDMEIRDVDAFVRRSTLEKFGPVRTVKPELVFELAFEGIQLSTRHKSGIAVRFPRIARWRKDKKPEDADTLDTVKSLLVETNPIRSATGTSDPLR
jgi:DNA ligase-1